MARFQCKCSFWLSDWEVPNQIQYHVYDDYEWSSILELDVVQVLEIPKPRYDVWRCPNCERIYVFSDSGTVIKRYNIEND